MEPEIIAPARGTFGLLAPLTPAGRPPPPEAFRRAETQYREASLAYEARSYLDAAEGFLRAAAALRLPAGGPYADAAAANRGILYRNAAYAWVMGDRASAAVPVLERLQREDPACAADLGQALQILRGGGQGR